MESFKENEREYLRRLLSYCKGNMTTAAKVSGISRATLYRKIAQYGVLRQN